VNPPVKKTAPLLAVLASFSASQTLFISCPQVCVQEQWSSVWESAATDRH